MPTWQESTNTWGGAELSHGIARPVFPIGEAFFQADNGLTFGEDDVEATLERVGLTISGRDQDGKPRSDPSLLKLLREMWPIFRGPTGTVIDIYVGSQETPEDGVSWLGPFEFTIGTTRSIQPLLDYVFLAVRFTSVGQPSWTLLSYDLDIEVLGVTP